MKNLEDIFAEAFDNEARKRGFAIARNIPPVFGANPFYKNSEWVVGSGLVTMFPDTTATIKFSPLHPPEDASLQHLLGCEAKWLKDQNKWLLVGREYSTEELIAHAFDQMKLPAK